MLCYANCNTDIFQHANWIISSDIFIRNKEAGNRSVFPSRSADKQLMTSAYTRAWDKTHNHYYISPRPFTRGINNKQTENHIVCISSHLSFHLSTIAITWHHLDKQYCKRKTGKFNIKYGCIPEKYIHTMLVK